MKTRAQKDMELAEQLVLEVKTQNAEVQEVYEGLCQKFPVLVMTCGLCQAVAFSEDKATADGRPNKHNIAHGLLLEHLAHLLSNGAQQDAAGWLHGRLFGQDVTASQYMMDTRRVMTAWIYFKRFAVSLLQSDPPQATAQGGAHAPVQTP